MSLKDIAKGIEISIEVILENNHDIQVVSGEIK